MFKRLRMCATLFKCKAQRVLHLGALSKVGNIRETTWAMELNLCQKSNFGLQNSVLAIQSLQFSLYIQSLQFSPCNSDDLYHSVLT